MGKIILSRKGFDSQYGGKPSPILDNSVLLSFPIPISDKNEKGIKYSTLEYNQTTYKSLMQQLGIKQKFSHGHLDPDLRRGCCIRDDNWKPAFGQAGGAASHLHNQKVMKGDIFLFYGSFGSTEEIEEKLQFTMQHERHIIFGYLMVKEIHKVNDKLHKFKYHPHYENMQLESYQPKNVIYEGVADKSGVFKYTEDLVLTKPGFKKSFWSLPEVFSSPGSKISWNPKVDPGENPGARLEFKSAAKGQEFVVQNNAAAFDWAKKMIKEYGMGSQ